MKLLYFLILIGTVIVPFLFSFHRKINFHKQFRNFILSALWPALVFVLWDIYFTGLGVWQFNSSYVSGIWIYILPLEEVLFFICIPFSCVFSYYCFDKLLKWRFNKQTETIIYYALLVLCLVVAAFCYEKLYTFWTALLLGLFLMFLNYIAKVDWLNKAFFAYTFLLIPFLVVNGILTGSWIDEPVVMYNDKENLGVRILTIPVEDIFYGFLLILMNLYFFERRSQRKGQKTEQMALFV